MALAEALKMYHLTHSLASPAPGNGCTHPKTLLKYYQGQNPSLYQISALKDRQSGQNNQNTLLYTCTNMVLLYRKIGRFLKLQ